MERSAKEIEKQIFDVVRRDPRFRHLSDEELRKELKEVVIEKAAKKAAKRVSPFESENQTIH